MAAYSTKCFLITGSNDSQCELYIGTLCFLIYLKQNTKANVTLLLCKSMSTQTGTKAFYLSFPAV